MDYPENRVQGSEGSRGGVKTAASDSQMKKVPRSRHLAFGGIGIYPPSGAGTASSRPHMGSLVFSEKARR